jgi:predicted hotdog family 3-hydroxylacyl-ACP dehydratase
MNHQMNPYHQPINRLSQPVDAEAELMAQAQAAYVAQLMEQRRNTSMVD